MNYRALVLCLAVFLPATAAPQITLDVHDAPLPDVIALLGAQSRTNIVTDESVKADRITLHLSGVTFEGALSVIVRSHGLQVRRVGDTLIVGADDAMNRRYDPGDTALGAQTAVLTLTRAKPDELAKELVDALPAGTVIVPDQRTGSVIVSGDRDTVTRARALVVALDAPSAGINQERTVMYALHYLRADDAIKQLKVLHPDGVFAVDDLHNAIAASGGAALHASVQGFVLSADRPGPQVLFEVKVADVTPESRDADVGLEWGGLNLQAQPSLGSGAYAFTGGSVPVNVTLNALITEGRAEILATPKILTLNNREADLLIGETYPIVFSTSVLGGQNVQFVDIGVKLRLTPTIGPDGVVTAELHPEYSELLGTTTTGYPIVANRKIDSTLRVADAQTIVLGGLMLDNDTDTVSRIPGLSAIPVIGKLFSNHQSHHERSEIVFLITPHVIFPGQTPPPK